MCQRKRQPKLSVVSFRPCDHFRLARKASSSLHFVRLPGILNSETPGKLFRTYFVPGITTIASVNPKVEQKDVWVVRRMALRPECLLALAVVRYEVDGPVTILLNCYWDVRPLPSVVFAVDRELHVSPRVAASPPERASVTHSAVVSLVGKMLPDLNTSAVPKPNGFGPKAVLSH